MPLPARVPRVYQKSTTTFNTWAFGNSTSSIQTTYSPIQLQDGHIKKRGKEKEEQKGMSPHTSTPFSRSFSYHFMITLAHEAMSRAVTVLGSTFYSTVQCTQIEKQGANKMALQKRALAVNPVNVSLTPRNPQS